MILLILTLDIADQCENYQNKLHFFYTDDDGALPTVKKMSTDKSQKSITV